MLLMTIVICGALGLARQQAAGVGTSTAPEAIPRVLQMQTSVHWAAGDAAAAPTADDGLSTLADLMTGHFSSEEQARTDSTYFDIRLVMEPIWQGQTDVRWLYVEQAVAGHEERPYRQRIYRLTETGPNQFESAVYLLPDPVQFVGAWNETDIFSRLLPGDLKPRTGCSIHLTRQPDGSFVGGTRDHDCPSDLRGASYATSSVRIEDGVMHTWDQGFDDAGEQVWGPTAGGYIFVKQPVP